MSERFSNPYLGPRTFEEQYAHLYFGREKEARDLLSIVISEPLVLFYAQSGAGKSSLINTRLVPGLRSEGFHVFPIGRVGGASSDESKQADNIFTYNLLSGINLGEFDTQELQHTSLTTFLKRKSEAIKDQILPRVLIIDQFEELITSQQEYWYQRESFFYQMNQALQADSLLWIVLSLREDYVAAIEPYAQGLPGGLQARFHMQRMRYPAALNAVKRPAADYGRPFAEDVAESLVDNLRQIRAHEPGDTRIGEFVEPVQLQVVCYQLWENLKQQAESEITAQDVAELGDVDLALAQFYERVIGDVLATTDLTELELRNWFERKLITEDETRGTVYQGPAETGGLENEAVHLLADQFLLRSEIRAGGTWYELVHDRFVAPILQSNHAWRIVQGPVLMSAEAWEQSNRNPGGLYDGAQLKEALASLDDKTLEPLAREFLMASEIAQRQREKEQARELAAAQAEAEHQRQRVEQQAKTGRLYRLLAASLLIVILVTLLFGIIAAGQARQQASLARANATLVREYADLNDSLATARAANLSAATANAGAAGAGATALFASSAGAAAAQATAIEAATSAANAQATALEANTNANANATILAASNANATATKLAAEGKIAFQHGRFPTTSYTGATDSTIIQGDPVSNFADLETCLVDGDDPAGSGNDMRALLRWDITAIPANATVTAASIILNVIDESDESYSLYRLKQDWSELEATWKSYGRALDWAAEGANSSVDRSASIIGNLHAPRRGESIVVFNVDGITAVQTWVQDPEQNHGIILMQSNATNGIDFHCSEVSDASKRPLLQISYTLP